MRNHERSEERPEDCPEEHQQPTSGRRAVAVSAFAVLVLCAISGTLGYVVGESQRQDFIQAALDRGYMIRDNGRLRWADPWEICKDR